MRADRSLHKFDDDEDDEEEESQIQWSDLIFLPFHPVFKMMVLLSVIVKTTLGPVQSIYSIVHCSDVMDQSIYLFFIKYFYSYICEVIYFVDTFLHIVHRQVTDKAMRREHLPKSGFLLILDVISLIPFYSLASYELCPPVQLWPNILAFSEFVVIYRIVEYFSLVTTHSYLRLLLGFTIVLVIIVNCVGCFLILLTENGLCSNCRNGMFDWRKYVGHKLNETDTRFSTYVYGTAFVFSFAVNTAFDETKPSTILEYFLVSSFMLIGYLLDIYVIMPKIFAESILGLRRICTFYPHVRRIIEETKRRNPCPTAYISVSNFYSLMWKKRKGITTIPQIISELPRYLRIDIRQDLVWPVFYHSPTLRNTSTPFKRWLCEFINLDYKLPGEKLYAGPHCHTNLYYLKTGIVELISADDGVTALLSLSGGTIFGDVSFIVPPLKRNLIVRCITYCEVFILPRYDILKAMQKYPSDRRHILASVKERIKHARTLNTCKQHVRGLDRTEDEGLAWLKRRWWEISEAVANWKNNPKKDKAKFVLPPEEAAYHCAKYIGQLVLCSDLQLRKKSQFANVKFPWILMPNSTFIKVWKKIVMFTVILALIMYPPNITKIKVRNWFRFIRIWTDFVYFSDLTISLMTSPRKHAVIDNFSSVMFARFKSSKFVLDIVSTMWIELLALLAGKPEFYYMLQFNRLLKVYILFSSDYLSEWSINRQPFFNVCYKVMLTNFCYVYILAYAIHVLMRYLPGLTPSYFFGERYCDAMKTLLAMCSFEEEFLGVAIGYTYELLFFEFPPHHLVDIYVAAVIAFLGFLTYMMTKCRFVAYLYLKYREITSYQAFVSNLRKYYTHHKIHHDLMKRLDRYLMCQWKYYHGADIMHPNMLKNEPFDIYWKVHGEVAEKIIRESKAFAGADPTMIKDLAYAANFLIVPKNATLFLFGVECRNVTWIVQGHIKCEYHNEEGELLKSYYDPGEMVSVSAVLLRKPSIRTYSSCTECEIIFIKIQDFFNIIKHYPQEWSYFQNCIEECEPVFEEMFEAYVKKHRDYQKKLRDRIFHARQSLAPVRRPNEPDDVLLLSPIDLHNWVDPDSDFMYYWMIFRALIVVVSITSASLQGGSGAVIKWPLTLIGAACDCIAWIDILLKLFMSHYNEKGILIYDFRMCATHYLTRGFLLDIVGAVPWFEFFRMILTQPIDDDQAMLMNTFCKFAHIYILMELFNHLADMPSINSSYILILKWQTMLILVMLGGSHYLMNHCIKFKFNQQGELNGIQRLNNCWIPAYMVLDEEPSISQLHLLFAQSFNLAQSGLMRMNLGKFSIDRKNLGVGIILVILGVIFWYVTCYSLTMMVLSARYNTLFQHHVSQLKKFLTAERVDQKLIAEAGSHFGYWWMRNKGINIHQLMNERFGVVFRQDLSYYFFKKTFVALDKLLGGGEQLQRQLSSMGYQLYLRPNQEVIREMDLLSYVFIVHRGKVIVTKEGTKLAELTKGSIFGQLEGTTPRPARVSVVSDRYADILQINIAQFQDTINDEVRDNIAENLQSQDDYMAVKKLVQENPNNTIEYILRGRKTIKLPWMKNPVEARRNTWYSKWLFVAWMISPFVTIVLVLLLAFIPHHDAPDLLQDIYWGLTAMDVIFLAHVISEFYTLDLVVVNDVLVKKRLGYRNLLNWSFYVDVVSMALPFITLISGNWGYQLARLLRLRLFYEFYQHFCTSFKSRVAPILMNSCIVFLLLHAMVCGWIFVACRNYDPFPVPILKVPDRYLKTIDRGEWVVPGERAGGCSRMTMNFRLNETGKVWRISFLVPRHWYNDYMVALMYIVLLHTHTVLDTVVALSIKEVYYKVFITACIFLLDMWLMSAAISAVYTKFRELYQYDYSVSNLTTYLHHSGLSPTLLDSVRRYTHQLWQRQRGNWLPELANQAPPCLREDLLSALYMHHLRTPGLFKNLPPYFTRQLVARFQRVVIFPGKCIVQEGDIFPCIYFIHEGEVEKWYTDMSGENKLMSLLTTNGYFGLIPGLFPNVPFQFSYYTRTVVDLVYLKLQLWQDLLNAYPKIRSELYDSAKQLKMELLRKQK